MPSAPATTDAGPRLQTLSQQGRGSLFFVMMFGLTVLMALRTLISSESKLAPSAFLLIGVVGLVVVQRASRLALRMAAVHERGLVLVRGAGEELIPWSDVREVRRDVGLDGQLAYLTRLPGDRLLRMVPPQRGAEAELQRFVESLASQAGLAWNDGLARRAA
jgi:hypothetical protein